METACPQAAGKRSPHDGDGLPSGRWECYRHEKIIAKNGITWSKTLKAASEWVFGGTIHDLMW